MAERRHGGGRGDARGGGRGGGRGDPQNEEAARQRDLRDIEIDDLRQQVRDLQRDVENAVLRQQVRDLRRRLAQREERRLRKLDEESRVVAWKAEHEQLDAFQQSEELRIAREEKKNSNSNILSMPVYDTPVYDEDIFSMPVYDEPVYDEDILSMPVYDKPVYDEDILYEVPGLMTKFPPSIVKFDDAAEDEGVAVDDDEEYDEAEGGNRLLGFMFGNVDGADEGFLGEELHSRCGEEEEAEEKGYDENQKLIEFEGNDAGLFASAEYDDEDKEADAVWEAIDNRMDSRRKDRREARLKEEIENYRASNPKITEQFADLKRKLHTMSIEEQREGLMDEL